MSNDGLKSGNLTVHRVIDNRELSGLWPRIREGLLQVGKRCDGVFWQPEDFYHEIKSNRAQLMVCTINARYVGFMVVRLDSHPDGYCLHVWALHHAGHDDGFTENVFAIIKQLKTVLGCVRISLSSSRKGWVRIAEKLGYQPTDTLYYFSD